MLSTLRYNAWQQKHTNLIFFEKIMSTSQKLRFCTVFLLLDQYDVIKNGYTLYRHVSDTRKHL